METPLVSVVVPTRNRAPLLDRLLHALDAQNYPHHEIIVVDDGSTDNTGAVLAGWQGPDRLALRLDRSRGSYAARNLGWRRARGEIIAFTDDDCLPQPTWITELVRALEDAAAVAAQGVTLARPGRITPFTHQIEQCRPGPPYRTCNIAYRRSVLEALGGFDASFRWYADNILGIRAAQQGDIAWVPRAIVLHPPRPRAWRNRAVWLARFDADVRHRQVLRQLGAERLRAAPAALPLVLWVLRPLVKETLHHARYAARHPRDYLCHMPSFIRDKRELLAALIDHRLRIRSLHLEPLSERPLVSVVIATRDRPGYLHDVLSALQWQTYSSIEIIVVNHGANERTHELARAFGVRHVTVSTGTLGAVRQAGVEAATGEVVAFVDDDCVPDPTWIQALVQAFREQPDAVGMQGRTLAEPGSPLQHAVSVETQNRLYQTCNIAYRREALHVAGGFDPSFVRWFEDTALAARILQLGPIGWEPRALMMHGAVPRRWLQRCEWQQLIADERRLAQHYRRFYWTTRGPGWILTTIARWLIGSPVKTIMRCRRSLTTEPRSYLHLTLGLVRERITLILALRDALTDLYDVDYE